MILLQLARALSPVSTSGGSQPFTAPVRGRGVSDSFLWPTLGSAHKEVYAHRDTWIKINLNIFPWAWDNVSSVVEHLPSTHRPWVLCQAPYQTNPKTSDMNSLTRLHLSCRDCPHF